MGKRHYDRSGDYEGQTDDEGRHYDRRGDYTGMTDDEGRHYDRRGNYTGMSDDEGRHYDRRGNYTGMTDDEDRHYDSRGNYEGSSEDDSGSCFVTTACVRLRGLPDNCRELRALRKLRDHHMLMTATGRSNVNSYYRLAPRIVAAIEQSPNPSAELTFIYRTCVVPTVSLVEHGQFDAAQEYYEKHVRKIAARYGIQLNTKLDD